MADWMGWTSFGAIALGVGLGWLLRGVLQPVQTAEAASETPPEPASIQMLELAYQSAVELSKFQGGFLARTSHELRSPLNSLIGMHQLILSDLCDSPEEEREFIGQAQEAALKMIQVLDDVLEVAKLEHGARSLEIQPLPLAPLLKELHTLTHLPAQNRNLRFQVQLPEAGFYVLTDPVYLRQVLVNLVDRVIRLAPDGYITVSVGRSSNAAQTYIWIDNPCPPESWSEPIDTLTSSDGTEPPSPGFVLLLNQTVMRVLQGNLELLPLPANSLNQTGSCIQCTVPSVIPENF